MYIRLMAHLVTDFVSDGNGSNLIFGVDHPYDGSQTVLPAPAPCCTMFRQDLDAHKPSK